MQTSVELLTRVDMPQGKPSKLAMLRPTLVQLVLLSIFIPACIDPLSADALEPEAAQKKFTVPDELAIDLVAAEPDVRQPLSIEFDERGRMWVLQYLQYPLPEGLKPVAMDRYLRTTYDKFPEPPPNGPKGADRIDVFPVGKRVSVEMWTSGRRAMLLLDGKRVSIGQDSSCFGFFSFIPGGHMSVIFHELEFVQIRR